MGEFRYDREGNFIDADDPVSANLRSTDYSRIIRAAEKILGEPDVAEDLVRAALEAVIRARSLGADANPAWRPLALKVQGLAYEALGEHREAIRIVEEAIALNPKIGKGPANTPSELQH